MNIFRPNFTNYTDEALMEAIALRNERAFAELYERYSSRMYRYFYRMLWRNEAKAEDFTQELFLKILEKPHLFDPGRSFRTWIYALAINLCKNEYRRAQRPDWEQRPSWEDPVSVGLDEQLFEKQLRQSIAQLNESQRQCFILRYQEALSVAEIAAIMDCPEGTVKSRLHHALQSLATHMHGWKTSY